MERKKRRMSLRQRNIKERTLLNVKIDIGWRGGGNEKGYNEQNVCAFEFVLKLFSRHDKEKSRCLSLLAFSAEFLNKFVSKHHDEEGTKKIN